MTFQEALEGRHLKGVPTYRLTHQPRYASLFTGKLYKAIWLRALGKARFTRLVGGGGG